ncbi:hypothetical protein [Agarilytica rhodophyticola]|uniref:hypothetical protein n=1 Tax=Agarilytica rhodophyticola TaxID=1737490 RepID=UPI000B34702A|nr:hypothetical protein [Agarilytica rhodophyticola]
MKYLFPLAMISAFLVAVDMISNLEAYAASSNSIMLPRYTSDVEKLDSVVEVNVHHDHEHMKTHSHNDVDISNWSHIPSVSLKAYPDPVSGWNINISTENFTFTPEMSGQENHNNEGHAHIYFDGRKVSRLYGNWFHLDKVIKGEHHISVTLNTNDHSNLLYHGKTIGDSIKISSDGSISRTDIRAN